jgi:hypothetical protein
MVTKEFTISLDLIKDIGRGYNDILTESITITEGHPEVIRHIVKNVVKGYLLALNASNFLIDQLTVDTAILNVEGALVSFLPTLLDTMTIRIVCNNPPNVLEKNLLRLYAYFSYGDQPYAIYFK